MRAFWLALLLALIPSACRQDDLSSRTPGNKEEPASDNNGESCTYLADEASPAVKVCYQSVDGLAIIGGDMIIGTVEQAQRIKQDVENGLGLISIRQLGSLRWPFGKVPYMINPITPTNLQAQIGAAVADYNSVKSSTGVQFVAMPWDSSDRTDHIVFVGLSLEGGVGGFSFVGRQGGPQNITLSIAPDPTQVLHKGVIIHEIGHALGFYHEHQRPDRNTFVTYFANNAIAGLSNQFDLLPGSQQYAQSAYDFASVMHYASNAFSTGPSKYTLKKKNGGLIPFNSVLSALDKSQMKAMYVAPKHPPTFSFSEPSKGTSIVLNYVDTNEAETGYVFEYQLSSGDPWIPLNAGAVTGVGSTFGVTLTPLLVTTNYNVRGRAKFAGNIYSGYSPQIRISTGTQPKAAVGVTTSFSDCALNVTIIDASTDETNFLVELDSSITFLNSRSKTIDRFGSDITATGGTISTSFPITSNTATTYYLRVTARNQYGSAITMTTPSGTGAGPYLANQPYFILNYTSGSIVCTTSSPTPAPRPSPTKIVPPTTTGCELRGNVLDKLPFGTNGDVQTYFLTQIFNGTRIPLAISPPAPFNARVPTANATVRWQIGNCLCFNGLTPYTGNTSAVKANTVSLYSAASCPN